MEKPRYTSSSLTDAAPVKERRESRHSSRGAEARKGDVFRRTAGAAHLSRRCWQNTRYYRTYRPKRMIMKMMPSGFAPNHKRIILILLPYITSFPSSFFTFSQPQPPSCGSKTVILLFAEVVEIDSYTHAPC